MRLVEQSRVECKAYLVVELDCLDKATVQLKGEERNGEFAQVQLEQRCRIVNLEQIIRKME